MLKGNSDVSKEVVEGFDSDEVTVQIRSGLNKTENDNKNRPSSTSTLPKKVDENCADITVDKKRVRTTGMTGRCLIIFQLYFKLNLQFSRT